MELVSYTIPCKTDHGEPLLLMPVGDIQWSGERGDTTLELLKRHIAWGVEHKAWFLGMGDTIDFMSPSNRQRLSSAALYDSAMDVIDDKAMELTEEIYHKALKPSKGRWLGMLEGHHFCQLKSGMTTDMRLCQMLDTKFLGTSAMIRLVFSRVRKSAVKDRGNVVIWAHHGIGGGQRAGSPLNKLDLLPAAFDADIFLMGHSSKKVAAPLDRVQAVWSGRGKPHLIHRTIIIANTGCFMKGYQEGRRDGVVPRGNYVEQRMLHPLALGGVLVRIAPRWGRHKSSDNRTWMPDLSVEL